MQRMLNDTHCLPRIAESLHGVFSPVSAGVVCCYFQLVVWCMILALQFTRNTTAFFRSSALLRFGKCLMHMFGSPPTIPTHSSRMKWFRLIGKKSVSVVEPASFLLLAVSLMFIPGEARLKQTQLSQQQPRGQLFLQLPRGLAIAHQCDSLDCDSSSGDDGVYHASTSPAP